MSKYEKILLCVFLLLASVIVSYNLFYVPSIPNLNVTKEEFTLKDSNNEFNNSQVVNINQANEEELTKIPGVGHSTAKNIIEYRNQNGGFSSISEIMNVRGIGESKFKAMKDSISVD